MEYQDCLWGVVKALEFKTRLSCLSPGTKAASDEARR
jgi:hypothetical protein